ncbi:coiled-coil domain-containing protein 167 isoform X1 [Tiliqua scincoides]|uniref:coiled-coil domain-containing protein 167 isoform X1 n=1 Tax=Tiliqua scincoides TaxID=71010 RepID=UPI0034626971
MPKKRRECISVAQEQLQSHAQQPRANLHSAEGGNARGLIKIDSLEEKLSQCRQGLEEVDFKLRREELTPEGRKSLEKEKSLLTTKVENYEKELQVLRHENRKNAALSVVLVLLVVVIYTCWTM